MVTDEGRTARRLHLEVHGLERLVTVDPVPGSPSRFTVSWEDTTQEVDVVRRNGVLSVVLSGDSRASHEVTCFELALGNLLVGIAGRQVKVRVGGARRSRVGASVGAKGVHVVAAPMPGRVVRVLIEPGKVVTRGQGVAVVEAMKMENELVAPVDGVVREVRAVVDDSVQAGDVLVIVSGETGDD